MNNLLPGVLDGQRLVYFPQISKGFTLDIELPIVISINPHFVQLIDPASSAMHMSATLFVNVYLSSDALAKNLFILCVSKILDFYLPFQKS